MKENSIKRNAFFNVVYTIVNMVFPLITYPYVTRVLSAVGMGKVSFFSSVSNYAIMFGSLGISTYGIRAVAKVRDDGKKLSKVTSELFWLNIIITVIVIFFLIATVPFIDKFSGDFFLLFINTVVIMSTPFGLNWLYSGLEQYSYITRRNIFFKTVSLILVFLLVKRNADYLLYAALTAFSTVGACLCNLLYSRKFVKICIAKSLKFKYHLKPMLLLFASILAVSVYTNLDTIMLGFINGDREVGLYTVATKVKWLLLSAVNAVSAVMLPRLSNYINNKKIDRYNQILKKSVSFIFLVTIPLAVYFILEAGDSILFLGGENYKDAIVCMKVLMPILVISGFSNITGNQILIPQGRDLQFMCALIIGAIVDVILNTLLMPCFGCIGAAMATLLAELTQMLIQCHYTQNDIRGTVEKNTIFKGIISTFIAAAGVIIFKGIINLNIFLRLFLTATVFFSTYGWCLLILKEKNVMEIMGQMRIKY